MIFIYVLLSIAVIIMIGMIYQVIATKIDHYKFQAPGKFIDLEGRKLHIQTYGNEEGPTVVFDHGCGIGSSSMIWNLVAADVAKFAKVITYDRAGYGWSDEGKYPRTNEEATKDLKKLIEMSNGYDPVILVGHSYGGVNVRLFSALFPEKVAGIVLVDPTHEDELTTRFPIEHVKGQLLGRKMFKMMHYMCKLGLLRLMGKMKLFKEFDKLLNHFPLKDRSFISSILFLSKTTKTVASEFSHLQEGYDKVRETMLGDIPLVVIKSGIIENLNGIPEEKAELIKQCLLDVAVETSNYSSNGGLVIAHNCGHNIHIEDPQLVVDAIRKVCEESRVTDLVKERV